MVSETRQYPATWFQRSLYAAASESLSGVTVPIAVRLRGSLDKPRLRDALDALIARHGALRTRLVIDDRQLWQVVEGAAAVCGVSEAGIEERECKHANWIQDCRPEFAKPFDLRGPLVRAVLIRMGEADHVLSLAAHHTVMDGWSAGIIVRELAALYAGDSLEPLMMDYGDYAIWERREPTVAEREYWTRRLARPQTRLYRCDPLSGEGEIRTDRHVLPQIEIGALESLARKYRVSNMALLSAVAGASMRRYVDESITAGVFLGNRDVPALAKTVGFIADLMPVPIDVGGRNLEVMAHEIADMMDDCNAHRAPLRAIRPLLDPRDDAPLFDMILNYLPGRGETETHRAAGLEMSCWLLEFLEEPTMTRKWWDGVARVDFRWRVRDGRLISHLLTTGMSEGVEARIVESISPALAAIGDQESA